MLAFTQGRIERCRRAGSIYRRRMADSGRRIAHRGQDRPGCGGERSAPIRARGNGRGRRAMRTKSSGPAEPSLPHQQAVDMTAPETFTTAPRQPLTKGRRPDMAAICALLPLPARCRMRRPQISATFPAARSGLLHQAVGQLFQPPTAGKDRCRGPGDRHCESLFGNGVFMR